MAIFTKIKLASLHFKKVYNKSLLVSNTLTTCALLGAGDLLTQYIEMKIADSKTGSFLGPSFLSSNFAMQPANKSIVPQSLSSMETHYNVKQISLIQKEQDGFLARCDWIRTAKLAAIGIMMGPFGHFWYTFLDKKYSKKTGLNILRKMICDQLFAAPIMNLMVLAGVTALEGKDFKHIMNLLKEKFLTVYAYDCVIWPAAQFVNFNFVSGAYRLLYVNTISLFWNALLSFLMFED